MKLWQFLGPDRYDYRVNGGPWRRWIILASHLVWCALGWCFWRLIA